MSTVLEFNLKDFGDLPLFPANLPNKNIKNGDEILSYGPHDAHRLEIEQRIVGYARAEILRNAVLSHASDEKLASQINTMFKTPTGGEDPVNNEQVINKRLTNALPAKDIIVFSNISEFLHGRGELNLDLVRSFFKENRNIENLSAYFSGEKTITYNNEQVTLKDILTRKNYQLDMNDGTLHCVSNERVHVNGQKLDDLVELFNKTAGADEFDKKKQFYEEYFSRLAKNGAYKDKTEITIMDIGVENGDLTKHIAETALKYFPEQKINIVAVERSNNFLKACDDKMQELINSNPERLSYTPVAHHIGNFGDPVTEKKSDVSNVDIFLTTDVRNFSTQNIVAEAKLYAAEDAVMLFKHGNKNDFQDKIREVLGKEVRNAGNKVDFIEGDFTSMGYDKIVRGELRAGFGLGFGQIDDAMKDKLLAVKQADYLNQPFKEGTPEFNKQRILEFIVGAPLAAFSTEVREKAIDLFNQHMEKGYAELCAGCQFFSVHNKEVSKEQKEAFQGSIKAVNPMAQFVGKDWNYLGK